MRFKTNVETISTSSEHFWQFLPPYWIGHLEFRNSNTRFGFSDPENEVWKFSPSSKHFGNFWPPYCICHLEFPDFDTRFEFSDPKNLCTANLKNLCWNFNFKKNYETKTRIKILMNMNISLEKLLTRGGPLVGGRRLVPLPKWVLFSSRCCVHQSNVSTWTERNTKILKSWILVESIEHIWRWSSSETN